MTKRTRSDVAATMLANLLASDAPAPTKAEIQSILAELQTVPAPLDEAALARDRPDLAARVAALSSVGLDLFRVLRGEMPALRSHRRTHVAAVLRYVRERHGRAPEAGDFPPGHIVPVLVWVYHRGFAAWGAGIEQRQQRPKGHWQSQGNQKAALAEFAQRFPGEAMTAEALTKAGYSGLVNCLPFAEIDALVAELGLSRELTNKPEGWWTVERCIDRYVALCREKGITLSNHALSLIGGDASSLRSLVVRHFDTFREFQLEVCRRHPDIRLPGTRTARDGTVMDSWPEVIVYEAVRAAWPNVAVDLHVALDGPRGPSCDFVLGDGRAWIEVRGMTEAEMLAPTSSYQRAYVERWKRKATIYRERALPLHVIDSADTVDADAMRGHLAAIATLLETPPAVAFDTRIQMRAHGTWTFAFLCEAVGEVALTAGGFPTNVQLREAGYGHAAEMLKEAGMADRVAAETGIALRNRKGAWPRERVIDAHVDWVQTHDGQFPTGAELMTAGQGELALARKRIFANAQDVLRDEVAQRTGLTFPLPRLPNGACDTQEQVAALLRPLCDQLGRFPTCAEMVAALPHHVHNTVVTKWGVHAMAATMGVPHTGYRRWSRELALAEFVRCLPRRRDLLSGGAEELVITCTTIQRTMGHTGIDLMQQYFGNIAGLRAALRGVDLGGPPVAGGTEGRPAA